MLSLVHALFTRGPRAARRTPPALRRLRLELLETRATPSGSRTWMVDDDGAQCRNPDFNTINAAVAAAAPGDTIKVCPGQYEEVVVVNKTLKLLGEGPSPTSRTGNPNREAIVEGDDPEGVFQLEANNILLKGFTVRNNDDGAGVYTSPNFSGYQVQGNWITQNADGMYFNSSGQRKSEVSRNFFEDNNAQGSGNGIYSEDGLRNAVIEHNLFTGHENYAINLSGEPGTQSNIDIRHNAMIDDAGIFAWNARDLDIEHNRIKNPASTGIYLYGGIDDATVAHNHISGGEFSGIVAGSPPSSEFGVGTVTRVKIAHNKVHDNAGDGIILSQATRSVVEKNSVEGNGRDGILLENADGNRVEKNRVFNNGGAGIHADADSAENHIKKNKMLGNGDVDARDDSVGPRTAGTANWWEKNKCETDNKGGQLCDHHGGHDDDDDDDDDDD